MLRYREHDVGVTWFPRVSLSCKIAADGGDVCLKKKKSKTLLHPYFFTNSKKEKVGRRKSSDTVGVGHGPIISYDALRTPEASNSNRSSNSNSSSSSSSSSSSNCSSSSSRAKRTKSENELRFV
ncbi:hypothetical protein HZH68_005110 [Vespula germanica]|uniref:Uncharacterized protein n=1 Tax=Vespula germanica TaxID=30212 RepID=A0A834KFB5_VESGE|nr:hypothetical protein HZH68_005110 [Vespula germanica]